MYRISSLWIHSLFVFVFIKSAKTIKGQNDLIQFSDKDTKCERFLASGPRNRIDEIHLLFSKQNVSI